MRDPDRIDRILRKLGVIWKAFPDERLGQIVQSLAYGRGLLPVIKDSVMEESLDDRIKRSVSAVDQLGSLAQDEA